MSGPNNGADDFTRTSGVVVFEDGQSMANLSIQVKPDNVSILSHFYFARPLIGSISYMYMLLCWEILCP